MFVADASTGTVSVISDANDSVVAKVAVGTFPIGIAYDVAHGEIFVTDSSSGAVSVISGTNNSKIATLSVGGNPSGIAYDPGRGELFVTNFYSGTISVISDSLSPSSTSTSTTTSASAGSSKFGVSYLGMVAVDVSLLLALGGIVTIRSRRNAP